MERSEWLAERRAAVVGEYDAMAATYREYPNDGQQRWVDRLLGLAKVGGVVLDAPCGTGRYFAQIRAAGCRVVGLDQSVGMVAEARRREIADAVHHVGLQEMTFVAEFDAAVTIDAMENAPPEDWPRLLANLHRAVRPGGHLYLTVEEQDRDAVDEAYADLIARGAPAVLGEVVEGDVAGYHYYPTRDQVHTWLTGAGWAMVDDEFTPENGWGYWHVLVRRTD